MATVKICPMCGKKIAKHGAKLCITCSNKSRAKNKMVKCLNCRKPFKFTSRGKDAPPKRFCSSDCANEYRSGLTRALQDFALAIYPSHGPDEVAAILGCSRDYVQNLANHHHVTLTKETAHRLIHSAAQKYMTDNNPMKLPETVEKVRSWWQEHPDDAERVHREMTKANQQIQRDKPSKLELKLRDILMDLNVDFEPSAIIKTNFIVDIRIGTLIIQADGEYWHGHPRFDPLTERQVRQQRRDRAQDKYLMTCGYTVIRIWERDVTRENVEAILRDHGILH